MKVTFVCMADWAGSCFQVISALQREGIDARQVILGTEGIYDFPKDIYVDCGIDKKRHRSLNHPKYRKVIKLIEQAEILHVWNDVPFDKDFRRSSFPLPYESKPIVNTFTGTLYRRDHTSLNLFIKDTVKSCKCKWIVTVQNPNLLYPEEIDSVFVPHAIDAYNRDNIYPEPAKRMFGKMRIGMYVGNRVEDSFSFAKEIVDKYFYNEVELVDLSRKPWKMHLQNVANCDILIQDIDESIGYWGRSALEACVIGIPCVAFLSLKGIGGLKQFGMDYEEIPLLLCNSRDFKEKIAMLIREKKIQDDMVERQLLWVRKYYDYKIVAKQYMELYRRIL